jgi:serine/threonine protein kinase
LKKLLDQSQFASFAREAVMLQSVSHPHVVNFLGCYTDDAGFKYIVTEFMSHGSLQSLVQKLASSLTATDLLAMARHAAAGMRYLEQQKIIHRDIALRNLLVTQYGQEGRYFVKVRRIQIELICQKVGDFGMARSTEQGTYSIKGSTLPIRWTAPECFKYGTYDSHSDVWSFGVLLWELFSYGLLPYPGLSNEEVVKGIMAGDRLSCPEGCPNKIYNLMLECWQPAPKDRPNFYMIFQKLQAVWEKYPCKRWEMY